MKKLFALGVSLILLLVPTSHIWARIDRIDGPKCNGTATMTQGETSKYIIEGHGVDLSTGINVSGSGVTATITQRWNGFQNQNRVGRMVGAIEIRLQASASAAVGNRTVFINYPVGKDSFTLKIIRKASIGGASVPTFSQPFQSNVDVRLTGIGLSHAQERAFVQIIRDSYHPLLDSGREEVQGTVTVTGQVNTSTNTDTQAYVRLNFSQRLTKATIRIGLSSLSNCSGLPANYTLTLTAPVGGPNYVKDHLFDRTNRSYRIGDVVTVTIRLDRSVSISGVPITSPPSLRKPPTQRQAAGEIVYWAVIPSNAVQQGGASGAPYDPNVRYNQITIPVRQQSKAITFQISRCTSGGNINTMKFVTWKPNPNDDSMPNRKETAFSVNCN